MHDKTVVRMHGYSGDVSAQQPLPSQGINLDMILSEDLASSSSCWLDIWAILGSVPSEMSGNARTVVQGYAPYISACDLVENMGRDIINVLTGL